MRTKIIFLAVALVLAPALHAQFLDASRSVDSFAHRRQMEDAASFASVTNVAPELYAGETSDIGPQSLLQFQPRRTWFQAFADEQYFYSDNMFLADKNPKNVDVLVSTVSAALAPTALDVAGGKLSPRLGYQHQWFNYQLAGNDRVNVLDYINPPSGPSKPVSLDAFDFNASTIFADAAWRWHDWTVAVGTDYRRLLDSESYNEFYSEFVPRWSVQRDFSICESVAIALLYEGNFRFTETQLPPPSFSKDLNNRTDQSLAVIANWRLCNHFSLQPFYRFQVTHYVNINRDDTLSSFGLAALIPVTQQITLRGFVGYDQMRTDGFFSQNYRNLQVGAGVNLTVRF